MTPLELTQITEMVVARIHERYILTERTNNFKIDKDAKSLSFVEMIIAEACKYFSMTKEELLSGKSRFGLWNKSEIRYIIMGLCREIPTPSFPYRIIGIPFKVDHSSVIYGLRKFDYLVENYIDYKKDYEGVKELVMSKLQTIENLTA